MGARDSSNSGNASTRKKLKSLFAGLKSKNFRRKNDAIEKLGKFKATEAVNKLYDVLKDTNWNYKHRIAAMNALAETQDNNRFKQVLKNIVDDPSENRELRRAALTHLAGRRDEDLVGLFRRSLHDEYRFIRFWAVRALLKLKSKKAERALIQALGDKDEEIRKDVYMHLEHSGPELVPFLKQAYKGPDANKFMRCGIMGLLGRIGKSEALPVMLDALSDGNDRVVRIAIRGLGKSQNIKAIEPLIDLYTKEEKYSRFIESSLYKIGRADINGAVAFMGVILIDTDDKNVKKLIVETLKKLVPDSIFAVGELKTDPQLNKKAIAVLDDLMDKLEQTD